MRGNTEASTTRSPRVPCTRKSLPTTARGSLAGPIGQVHEAWWPQALSRTKARSSSRVSACRPGTSSVATSSSRLFMIDRATSMPVTTASRSSPAVSSPSSK